MYIYAHKQDLLLKSTSPSPSDVRETHFLVAPIATTNHPSIVRNADVAIVPVRGTLLHRLVDQITTGSSGTRLKLLSSTFHNIH